MLAADLPRDKAIAAMVPEEKGFSKPFFGRHMIGKVDEQWVMLSIVHHILSKLSIIFSRLHLGWWESKEFEQVRTVRMSNWMKPNWLIMNRFLLGSAQRFCKAPKNKRVVESNQVADVLTIPADVRETGNSLPGLDAKGCGESIGTDGRPSMLVSQGFPSWKPHLPARNFSYIMTTWGLISGLFCCPNIHEVIHHLIWRFPKPPYTSNHPSISKSFQVMNDTRRLSWNVRARACPRSCPRCPKPWISPRERGQKSPAERWELPVD